MMKTKATPEILDQLERHNVDLDFVKYFIDPEDGFARVEIKVTSFRPIPNVTEPKGSMCEGRVVCTEGDINTLNDLFVNERIQGLRQPRVIRDTLFNGTLRAWQMHLNKRNKRILATQGKNHDSDAVSDHTTVPKIQGKAPILKRRPKP